MKKIIQFGYKWAPEEKIGHPVVDCRVIINPYEKGVPDEVLKARVRNAPGFYTCVDRAVKLFEHHDTVFIGCQFGKHRSGAVAERVAAVVGAKVEVMKV